MSEEIDFDESTPEGIKSLRKAFEKMQEQLKTERENNSTLAAKQRSRDVADKLKDLGAKPGLAEFVPASIEVENLGAWLTEKADLFGFKVNDTSAESTANAEEAAALERMSGFSAQLPGDVSDNPDLKAIYEAKSGKELAELIYARQAGIK